MNETITPVKLPEAFLERMKEMLGDDFEAFLKSYENPRTYGLRVNTSKISCEEFEKIVPFLVKRIPWTSNGYFYNEEDRPSRCPFYQAGLYYLQEPSAMTPAACLPVAPGEYVLDMCAAPGGKATALGDVLKGEGLLVANDISTSRARALLRNIELSGIANVFVANEPPAKLTKAFPEYFHKIILDAPCSGEGMFRKEEALARDWTPEKSAELSIIQKELLENAYEMLRPGGMLLYSTCTFAPIEDEEAISYLLTQHPEMELLPLPEYEGFSHGIPSLGNGDERLSRCVRIFPHKMNGEGHFLALLQKPEIVQSDENTQESTVNPARSFASSKKASKSRSSHFASQMDKETRKWVAAFFEEIGIHSIGGIEIDWNRIEARGEKIYYLPPVAGNFRGLTFLRNGLYLGDLKKNRFEPSQPLALAIRKEEAKAIISLPVKDDRLTRYLKGETIVIEQTEATHTKGWHLLCADGYPIGFGKLVNGTLKNKYPAGWRV